MAEPTPVRARDPRAGAARVPRAPARLLALAVAGALVGLLAGCGSSHPAGDPVAGSSQTHAADPSPSRPGPPTLPAAARKHTKAGAIAFVRHYIDLINYAQRTLHYKPLALLEAFECESCKAARTHIMSLRRRHAKIRGGAWTIHGFLKVSRTGHAKELSVPARIHYGPQTVRTAAKETKYPGGNNVITFFAAWTNDEWKLEQWTRAK